MATEAADPSRKGDQAPADHPCRISVFMATASTRSVVVRRGPSDWVQLCLWDRADDRVSPGQWFRGRVYERRADLSPDGRLFVYFAAKYGRPSPADGIGETWTAVSRPPHFTALALWSNLGGWYGGGMFEAGGRLLLDTTCGEEMHPRPLPSKLTTGRVAHETAPWELRLVRDGWTLVERGFHPRSGLRIGARELWTKRHPDLDLTLFRECGEFDAERYGGPHWDTYWLESGDDLTPLPEATWADFDRGQRLVTARSGVLTAGNWSNNRLLETMIHDFNPHEPNEVETPDWAHSWEADPT